MTARERRIRRHKEIMAEMFTDAGYEFTLRDLRYFRFYGKRPSMSEFDMVTYRAYRQVEKEEGTNFDILDLLVWEALTTASTNQRNGGIAEPVTFKHIHCVRDVLQKDWLFLQF